MRTRLIFTLIVAAAFPLFIYVIMPCITPFLVSGGSDPMGNGMEKGFTYIYGCIFFSAVLLIISMIVAHIILHQWWMGLVASALGLFLTWFCFFAYETYSQNVICSYTKYYYEDGELSNKVEETGHHIGDVSSRKHGVISYYRLDGTLDKTETFRRDIINGPIRLYHLDGVTLKAKGTQRPVASYDHEGVPDGEWSYYYENGKLADKRCYDHGTLLSSERYTIFSDTARVVCTIADHRPYTGTLNRTGVIGDGLFPTLVTARVVNGVYDGPVTEYYDFGDTTIIALQTTIVHGQIDGDFIRYHENGQIEITVTLRLGKYEGLCISYYADEIANRPHGTIQYSCDYLNGKRHGTARWYYRCGSLETESAYVNGKRHGIQREYSEDGTLTSEIRYVNDEKEIEDQQ